MTSYRWTESPPQPRSQKIRSGALGKITFDEWFADWSARQVWADGPLEAARQAAASVTFGAVRVRLILRSHVETWVKQMSTTLAASTTRMRYNYVHMGFRAAVRDKIIREAPSDGVALPKVARAEVTMVIPKAGSARTISVSDELSSSCPSRRPTREATRVDCSGSASCSTETRPAICGARRARPSACRASRFTICGTSTRRA